MPWWKKSVARGNSAQEKQRWTRMEDQESFSASDTNHPGQSLPYKTDCISDPESQSFLSGPQIAQQVLIAWRISIVLPFLTAGCLLYLLTCSAPTWRASWSVVTIGLAVSDFNTLYDIAETITGSSSNSTQSNRRGLLDYPSVAARFAAVVRDDGGNEDPAELSVNMWGWCLRPASDADENTVCSSEKLWFDLDDLLGAASTQAGLSDKTFSAALIHALIGHGLAMLAAMMAIVPIGLTTWRILRSKNPTMQGGWFEHVGILSAALLCLIAWIIDRCLQANVSSKLSGTDVEAGLASVITGVCAILLGVAFFVSSLPVLYFHMKRQTQLLKYWQNLEDYDEALARQEEQRRQQNADNDTQRRMPRRPKRRQKRLRDHRLTRMFSGKDKGRDEREKEESTRKRREHGRRRDGRGKDRRGRGKDRVGR
ncbi:hypothetical protein IAR50_006522 [Cryptococcus sp. DSM 104548]